MDMVISEVGELNSAAGSMTRGGGLHSLPSRLHMPKGRRVGQNLQSCLFICFS